MDDVNAYYKLRGWTLEDHPIDEHKEEVERWAKSMHELVDISAVDKDCPSY